MMENVSNNAQLSGFRWKECVRNARIIVTIVLDQLILNAWVVTALLLMIQADAPHHVQEDTYKMAIV